MNKQLESTPKSPLALSRSREPGLDLLRACAILMVFTFHYKLFSEKTPFSILSKYGWAGVDLFFVLSGYLIGSQVFKGFAKNKKINLGRFYLQRFLRTLPAFWVVLLLYVFIPGFTERSHLPPIWRILTFTQNISLNENIGLAFSHAWSLCIEEQFYFFLPLIIIIIASWANTRRVAVLGILIILGGILLRWGLWHHYVGPALELKNFKLAGQAYYEFIYYPTYTRLDGLLIGLGLAACSVFKKDLWKKLLDNGKILGVLGILAFGSAIIIQDSHYGLMHSLFIFPVISLGAACFIVFVLSPSVIFSRTKIPGAEPIAILAYSVYLTHKQVTHLVIEFLKPLGFDSAGFTCFFIAGLCSLLVGIILYSVVEKPFLKLREILIFKGR